MEFLMSGTWGWMREILTCMASLRQYYKWHDVMILVLNICCDNQVIIKSILDFLIGSQKPSFLHRVILWASLSIHACTITNITCDDSVKSGHLSACPSEGDIHLSTDMLNSVQLDLMVPIKRLCYWSCGKGGHTEGVAHLFSIGIGQFMQAPSKN